MENFERKIFYPRALFLHLALGVFIATTLPGDATPLVDYFTLEDKIYHFITFLVLAWSLHFADFKISFKIQFIILLCFGILIEFAQSFIPYRYADGFDVIANILGTLGFYGIFWSWKHFKKQH